MSPRVPSTRSRVAAAVAAKRKKASPPPPIHGRTRHAKNLASSLLRTRQGQVEASAIKQETAGVSSNPTADNFKSVDNTNNVVDRLNTNHGTTASLGFPQPPSCYKHHASSSQGTQELSNKSRINRSLATLLPHGLFGDDAVTRPPALARSAGRSTLVEFAGPGGMFHTVTKIPRPSPPGDFDLSSFWDEASGSLLTGTPNEQAFLPSYDPNATVPDQAVSSPSPMTALATNLLERHISPVVSSDNVGAVAAAAAAPSTLTALTANGFPPGSRLVQTEEGPALLLSSLPNLALPVATSSAPRQFQHWTREEDVLLKNAVAIEGGGPFCNWKHLAAKYFLNSRNASQCKGRWKRLKNSPGSLLNRAPWSIHEDQFVTRARENGESWPMIAARLPGRIAEQIRERYTNHLDPSLITTPWTEHESRVLYQAQLEMGNKWSEISKLLPGRSENSIKNRWHNAKMMQRRKMRRLSDSKVEKKTLEQARSHAAPPLSLQQEPLPAMPLPAMATAFSPTQTAYI